MAKIDKLLQQATAHLDQGEQIEAAVQGTYEAKVMGSDSVRAGLLAATDRRIVFYAKKIGGFELESFPYGNVSSFEQSKTMMGHGVSFFASGNRVSMKWISDAAAMERFVAAVKGRMHSGAAPAPAAVSAPPNDSSATVEALKQLGELHTAGILSDDEFATKKAELIARL